MKAITKYQANDGTEFTSETGCADYEERTGRIAAVVSRLKPIPQDGCDFANGGGYVQQDRETVAAVRRDLLLIAKEKCSHKWIQESIDNPTSHPSWAARLIGEGDCTPLYVAWSRIMCLDKQCREWGQPYYAENPDKANIQLEVAP